MINKQGIIAIAVVVLLGIGAIFSPVSYNDMGERTVVQTPNGGSYVQFGNGFFINYFGRTTAYDDVVSLELPEEGISVRYRDGGKGTVDGVVRINLPDDEDSMLKLHKDFKSQAGLESRLLAPEVKQALNLTAGMMSSEEAYADKRDDFANWATEQIESGVYKTEQNKDGKIVIKLDKEGRQIHQRSPFTTYSINVSGFQVTDWRFEPATEAQIQEKRKAEMAEITAQAAAKQAIQETIAVEEQGKKAVAAEKYKQLQDAQKLIVDAQRQLEVNEFALKAANIDVATAKEQALATKTRADAEAYQKRVIMEADGALEKKLEAYVETQKVWADAYSKRAVPSIVMGGETGSGGNSDTSQFQNMLNAMVAKDLLVNPKMNK